MELTLEELADQLVSLIPQYAQDYYMLLDWNDEPVNPYQIWTHVALKEIGTDAYTVAWGIFDDPQEPFEDAPTIREAIEVALKEIKRTHGMAEERRRELLDEEAEC